MLCGVVCEVLNVYGGLCVLHDPIKNTHSEPESDKVGNSEDEESAIAMAC